MWLALVLGCVDSSLSSTAFEGGEFDFSTVLAKDECLEGALRAFFMPEGLDTPHPFEYPIFVPSWDELPQSYAIDLREPFMGMPVTVSAGAEGVYEIRGSVMDSVVLDETKYGDCAVTMTVDADLTPVDTDNLEGEARIAISDPRGEDELCPVFSGDPCQVTLALEASRR